MKIHASIIHVFTLGSGLLTMALAGCNDNAGPGPAIHDQKYAGIDSLGQPVADGAPGACVLDQFTGLTWEVKSDEPGLRYRKNTYSWFDPGEDSGGELDYRGTPGGGDCTGSACDTASYVNAVNAVGLCSFHDWRMPSRDELGSISDPRKTTTPPTVNSKYFPNTEAAEYWSANDYHFHWDAAWVWSFGNGMDRVEWKASPRHVRLVRGSATYLERVKD